MRIRCLRGKGGGSYARALLALVCGMMGAKGEGGRFFLGFVLFLVLFPISFWFNLFRVRSEGQDGMIVLWCFPALYSPVFCV